MSTDVTGPGRGEDQWWKMREDDARGGGTDPEHEIFHLRRVAVSSKQLDYDLAALSTTGNGGQNAIHRCIIFQGKAGGLATPDEAKRGDHDDLARYLGLVGKVL